MAAVGLAAATAEWGWKPLVSLSGPKVSASHSFVLLLANQQSYHPDIATKTIDTIEGILRIRDASGASEDRLRKRSAQ